MTAFRRMALRPVLADLRRMENGPGRPVAELSQVEKADIVAGRFRANETV